MFPFFSHLLGSLGWANKITLLHIIVIWYFLSSSMPFACWYQLAKILNGLNCHGYGLQFLVVFMCTGSCSVALSNRLVFVVLRIDLRVVGSYIWCGIRCVRVCVCAYIEMFPTATGWNLRFLFLFFVSFRLSCINFVCHFVYRCHTT